MALAEEEDEPEWKVCSVFRCSARWRQNSLNQHTKCIQHSPCISEDELFDPESCPDCCKWIQGLLHLTDLVAEKDHPLVINLRQQWFKARKFWRRKGRNVLEWKNPEIARRVIWGGNSGKKDSHSISVHLPSPNQSPFKSTATPILKSLSVSRDDVPKAESILPSESPIPVTNSLLTKKSKPTVNNKPIGIFAESVGLSRKNLPTLLPNLSVPSITNGLMCEIITLVRREALDIKKLAEMLCYIYNHQICPEALMNELNKIKDTKTLYAKSRNNSLKLGERYINFLSETFVPPPPLQTSRIGEAHCSNNVLFVDGCKSVASSYLLEQSSGMSSTKNQKSLITLKKANSKSAKKVSHKAKQNAIIETLKIKEEVAEQKAVEFFKMPLKKKTKIHNTVKKVKKCLIPKLSPQKQPSSSQSSPCHFFNPPVMPNPYVKLDGEVRSALAGFQVQMQEMEDRFIQLKTQKECLEDLCFLKEKEIRRLNGLLGEIDSRKHMTRVLQRKEASVKLWRKKYFDLHASVAASPDGANIINKSPHKNQAFNTNNETMEYLVEAESNLGEKVKKRTNENGKASKSKKRKVVAAFNVEEINPKIKEEVDDEEIILVDDSFDSDVETGPCDEIQAILNNKIRKKKSRHRQTTEADTRIEIKKDIKEENDGLFHFTGLLPNGVEISISTAEEDETEDNGTERVELMDGIYLEGQGDQSDIITQETVKMLEKMFEEQEAGKASHTTDNNDDENLDNIVEDYDDMKDIVLNKVNVDQKNDEEEAPVTDKEAISKKAMKKALNKRRDQETKEVLKETIVNQNGDDNNQVSVKEEVIIPKEAAVLDEKLEKTTQKEADTEKALKNYLKITSTPTKTETKEVDDKKVNSNKDTKQKHVLGASKTKLNYTHGANITKLKHIEVTSNTKLMCIQGTSKAKLNCNRETNEAKLKLNQRKKAKLIRILAETKVERTEETNEAEQKSIQKANEDMEGFNRQEALTIKDECEIYEMFTEQTTQASTQENDERLDDFEKKKASEKSSQKYPKTMEDLEETRNVQKDQINNLDNDDLNHIRDQNDKIKEDFGEKETNNVTNQEDEVKEKFEKKNTNKSTHTEKRKRNICKKTPSDKSTSKDKSKKDASKIEANDKSSPKCEGKDELGKEEAEQKGAPESGDMKRDVQGKEQDQTGSPELFVKSETNRTSTSQDAAKNKVKDNVETKQPPTNHRPAKTTKISSKPKSVETSSIQGTAKEKGSSSIEQDQSSDSHETQQAKEMCKEQNVKYEILYSKRSTEMKKAEVNESIHNIREPEVQNETLGKTQEQKLMHQVGKDTATVSSNITKIVKVKLLEELDTESLSKRTSADKMSSSSEKEINSKSQDASNVAEFASSTTQEKETDSKPQNTNKITKVINSNTKVVSSGGISIKQTRPIVMNKPVITVLKGKPSNSMGLVKLISTSSTNIPGEMKLKRVSAMSTSGKIELKAISATNVSSNVMTKTTSVTDTGPVCNTKLKKITTTNSPSTGNLVKLTNRVLGNDHGTLQTGNIKISENLNTPPSITSHRKKSEKHVQDEGKTEGPKHIQDEGKTEGPKYVQDEGKTEGPKHIQDEGKTEGPKHIKFSSSSSSIVLLARDVEPRKNKKSSSKASFTIPVLKNDSEKCNKPTSVSGITRENIGKEIATNLNSTSTITNPNNIVRLVSKAPGKEVGSQPRSFKPPEKFISDSSTNSHGTDLELYNWESIEGLSNISTDDDEDMSQDYSKFLNKEQGPSDAHTQSQEVKQESLEDDEENSNEEDKANIIQRPTLNSNDSKPSGVTVFRPIDRTKQQQTFHSDNTISTVITFS